MRVYLSHESSSWNYGMNNTAYDLSVYEVEKIVTNDRLLRAKAAGKRPLEIQVRPIQEILNSLSNQEEAAVHREHRSDRKDGSSISLDGLLEFGFQPSGEESDPLLVLEHRESIGKKNEILSFLHKAIRSLPNRQRQIITAIFFGKQKQSEMAHELGISSAAVSKTLKKALKNLKEAVSTEITSNSLMPQL